LKTAGRESSVAATMRIHLRPIVAVVVPSVLFALAAGCDEKKPDATPATSSATAAASSAAAPATASASAEPATTGSAAPATSDSAGAAAGGPVEARIEDIKVVGGKVDGADRRVKTLRFPMKSCLTAALKKEPATAGSVKVSALLDGEGKVKKITTTPDGKVSDELVGCVKKALEKTEFDTPSTAKTSVDFNVVFGPPAEKK
jgi:hypothetical protein